MRGLRAAILLVMGAALAGPAAAGAILHLASGAAMPIASYELKGEMIHVDLGDDAFMAFPVSMVEKIVEGGRDVMLEPSFNKKNNIISADTMDANRSYPVTGIPPRARTSDPGIKVYEEHEMDPNVEISPRMGIAVYRPDPHGSKAKRSLAFSGNRNVLNSPGQTNGGYRGTVRMGSKFVIGNPNPRRTHGQQSVNLTGVQMRKRSGGGGSAPRSNPAEDPAPAPPPADSNPEPPPTSSGSDN